MNFKFRKKSAHYTRVNKVHAEVLARNICANPRIIGLSLPSSTSLLPVVSQYADDISLIVTTNDSIKAVLIRTLCLSMGLVVN